MKSQIKTKLLSALLVAVMVFLMIPFSVIPVSAQDNEFTPPTTGHKLLSTYDAFSGEDIRKAATASVNTIFNQAKLSELLQTSANYTPSYFESGKLYEGSDMSSFAKSFDISLSRSFGGSIGIEKLFKISASQKFELAIGTAVDEKLEEHFYEYVINVEKGYYQFDEGKLDAIRNDADDCIENYLMSSFIDAIKNEDPKTFFEKYGTHIITAYTAGGTAGVYSHSRRTESQTDFDLSGEYKSEAGVSTTIEGVTGGAESAFQIAASVDLNESNKNYKSEGGVYVYGGGGAGIVAFSEKNFTFEGWVDSIDNNNAVVILDERLRLMPIWELLPDYDGREDRELQLMDYFINRANDDDNSFYANYFGEANYEIDYSKDWLSFDNAKIITNEEELNSIRDDLRGVYVLANDIALSDYANWEPIGTKEKPFKGRFYGNNNTISGLNIYIESFEDEKETLIGLFGCNDGLITDVKIDGSIVTPTITSSNVFIASVAAYNNGIVNNCFSDVEYPMNYDSAAFLKLSLEQTELNSDTTYTVGEELGLYLKGDANNTYSNVNIEIAESDSNSHVYIVLEDVNITGSSLNGTIYNPTSRDVYLISYGESNSIKGTASVSGINNPNSALYILGTSELNVYGGNGANGKNGATGKDGEAGGVGGDGIIAEKMYVSLNALNVTAGNGGNGGKGGDSEDGQGGKIAGEGADAANGGNAILCEQLSINSELLNLTGGNGGAGGAGGSDGLLEGDDDGNGGNGGNGGLAISSSGAIYINSSEVSLVGGAGGNGGEGRNNSKSGNGGAGGCAISDITPHINASKGVLISGNGGDKGPSSGKFGNNGTTPSPKAEIYVQNKRYVLYDEVKKWVEAKEAAEEHGAHLATVTSQEENDIIFELISYGNTSEFFIGAERGDDPADNLSWKWVTGEEFSFKAWATGEPNGPKKEYYVGVKESKGGWNDYPTDKTLGYIEEYDLIPENTSITTGVVVAYNTPKGNEINSNNLKWENNLLKIKEVNFAENEFYSSSKAFDTVFDDAKKEKVSVDYYSIPVSGGGELLEFRGSFVTPGISAITVEYGDYQRLIPIKITETRATNIEITSMPKTDFEIWDTFDCSELEFKAFYNDGSIKENITPGSDYNLRVTVPDMNSLGDKEVQLSYLGVKDKYFITVEPKTIYMQIDITGSREVGSTLTAEQIYISDKSAEENLSYQWLLDGVEKSKGKTLTISESMTGKTLTLKVSAYGNYRCEFETSISVDKKEQSMPEFAPKVLEKSNTSVILEEASGMQYTYSLGNLTEPDAGSVWQSSGKFEGLTPNTTYSFFVRKACNSTSNPSMPSSATVVTTLKTTISGTVTVSGGSKAGETLTCDISNITENAEISYQWYRDGVAIKNAVSDKYTISDEDKESEIYVIIKGINSYTGELQSNTVLIPSGIISSDAFKIVFESKSSQAGATVDIVVSLENNPGIAAASITLEYNESVLDLKNIKNGELLPTLDKGVNLFWSADENCVGDGALVTLTFEINENAEAKDYVISARVNEVLNENYKAFELAVVEGKITVSDFIYGDVNGDGAVSSADVLMLRKYMANYNYDTGTSSITVHSGADANGDGDVTSADVLILRKYMANYDYETGVSSIVLGPKS